MCFCRAPRTDPGRASSSCPAWPSRAGPRAGQSPFRSTSVRRRRRGGLGPPPAHGPRLAASLPCLRARAQPLGSSLRGRAAPPPGSFAPARGPRLAAPPSVRGLGRLLCYFHTPSPLCGARVVPLGPPRRLAATPVAGTGGGRVPPSRGCVRGERRGDVSLPLAFLQRDGGAVLQAHSYHPSWDKQEPSNEVLLRRTHCVPA